jgi:transcriptional regulator with XRE-family HTH domain
VNHLNINLEVIKRLRIKNNLKLIDISTLLGYKSKNGYWKIENGETKLSAQQLKILSGFYNVDMQFFFTDDSPWC